LQNISVVAQDFVKYEMTIRENIAISDTEHLYDEKRISENIERVGLSGIDDYDAVLGRRFGGMELSGGEWQKLAISRGTYKECDFIALDEPSSNLDPVVETQILQKILEVAHNRTVVIVSHRLGLCKFCDQIIVMEDGKVAEMGTHKELMDVGDKYARLYAMQAKWYE
jgi:ABC-type multidrug transport system fused ATPase/permease subunit